jgi:spore germination protein KB
LLGKWFGKIVSLIFVLITLVTATQITWYVGNFITTTYTPEESTYPINILFVAIIVIAMLYGLEAMCRSCTIYFIFFFPLYITTLLMLSPNMKVNNLLPIFEKGIFPVLKGTIPLVSLTALPMIVLNMIYPSNMDHLKKAKKSMFYGYLLGMITVFIGVLLCILVLGSTFTANSRFPLFILTQEINVGVIFSRLEAVVIAVWLTTNFISTFFYFYAGTKGLSQLLKLKDYRKIVLPLGLIMAVYSNFIYKNVPYELRWDTYVWPPLAFTFGFILPVILLIISLIRRRLGKRKVISK